MLVTDGQKRVDAALESRSILLPEQIMQEHSHGVHAERLRPAKLLVNFFGIECGGMPHFELIDCVGRQVIASHEPRFARVPLVCAFFGPTVIRGSGGWSDAARGCDGAEDAEAKEDK